MGDLEKARKLANKLKNNDNFYKTQSETAKNNFNSFFGEEEYIYNMKKVIEKVMSDD